MTAPSRASVVSSFTVIKGAMIDETYRVFAAWDLRRTKRENLQRLREENPLGAGSSTWLRDIAKVLNRRFEPDGRDSALVLLAQRGCSLDEWAPLMLWHMTRDEFLVRDFLQNWLFPAYDGGVFRLRTEDVRPYLQGVTESGGTTEHPWTEPTTKRVAAGLLKIATDFGLLRGGSTKEFATYHLPERSFMYLLHAMRQETMDTEKLINRPDWRMYLRRPVDIEAELLRLHQYRRLSYEVAGSLAQLSLPYTTAYEYAERMAE